MEPTLCELDDPSQRLKHWHATQRYEVRWSAAQMRSNPTTSPGHRTGDNDGGDDDFKILGLK